MSSNRKYNIVIENHVLLWIFLLTIIKWLQILSTHHAVVFFLHPSYIFLISFLCNRWTPILTEKKITHLNIFLNLTTDGSLKSEKNAELTVHIPKSEMKIRQCNFCIVKKKVVGKHQLNSVSPWDNWNETVADFLSLIRAEIFQNIFKRLGLISVFIECSCWPSKN